MDEALMKYLKPSDEAAYKKEMEKAQGDYAAAEAAIKGALENSQNLETITKLSTKLASSSTRVLEVENKYKKLAQEHRKADEGANRKKFLKAMLKKMRALIPEAYETARIMNDLAVKGKVPVPTGKGFDWFKSELKESIEEMEAKTSEKPDNELLKAILYDLHVQYENYHAPSDYVFSHYRLYAEFIYSVFPEYNEQIFSILEDIEKNFPDEYRKFESDLLALLNEKNKIVEEYQRKKNLEKVRDNLPRAGAVMPNIIAVGIDHLHNKVYKEERIPFLTDNRPTQIECTVNNRTQKKIMFMITRNPHDYMTDEDKEVFTRADIEMFDDIISSIPQSYKSKTCLHIPISIIARNAYPLRGNQKRNVGKKYLDETEKRVQLLLDTEIEIKGLEAYLNANTLANNEDILMFMKNKGRSRLLGGSIDDVVINGQLSRVLTLDMTPIVWVIAREKGYYIPLARDLRILPLKCPLFVNNLSRRLTVHLLEMVRKGFTYCQVNMDKVYEWAGKTEAIQKAKQPRNMKAKCRNWLFKLLDYYIKLWKEADEDKRKILLPIKEYEPVKGDNQEFTAVRIEFYPHSYLEKKSPKSIEQKFDD